MPSLDESPNERILPSNSGIFSGVCVLNPDCRLQDVDSMMSIP